MLRLMLHEIPPTDVAETYAQRWKLDDVITLCRDSSLTFRAAASISSAHRDELMAFSRRRSGFAHRLSNFARDPEDANETGSMGGRARRWFVGTRSRLLGQTHLGDSLAACLRAEATTTRGYARALAIDWNGDIADVLEEQFDELVVAETRIRALRGQL
jgi:uncharacterized protein (TIGR02284 family)